MQPHVEHLARLLTFVSQKNNYAQPNQTSIFYCGDQEPIGAFLGRLDQCIRCSESCYAIALLFVDRITEMNSDVTLNIWTVKKLFTTGLLLANQTVDDKSECAIQFANVVGFSHREMATMKTEFCLKTKFRLFVTPDEVRSYADQLKGRFSAAYFTAAQMWAGYPNHNNSSHLMMSRMSSRSQEPLKQMTAATSAPMVVGSQNAYSHSCAVVVEGSGPAKSRSSRHSRLFKQDYLTDMVSNFHFDALRLPTHAK